MIVNWNFIGFVFIVYKVMLLLNLIMIERGVWIYWSIFELFVVYGINIKYCFWIFIGILIFIRKLNCLNVV